MAAESLKKVKILVLGDSGECHPRLHWGPSNFDRARHVGMVVLTSAGVGKTSLVHLICHKEVFSSPSWTVGCSVEVKVS